MLDFDFVQNSVLFEVPKNEALSFKQNQNIIFLFEIEYFGNCGQFEGVQMLQVPDAMHNHTDRIVHENMLLIGRKVDFKLAVELEVDVPDCFGLRVFFEIICPTCSASSV